MARDSQCHRGRLCGKHERECVERAGTLDEVVVLEAKGARLLDEHVGGHEIIAACATQPCGMPRIEYLALGYSDDALPRLWHAIRVPQCLTVFHNDAAQPNPVAVLATTCKRKTSA